MKTAARRVRYAVIAAAFAVTLALPASTSLLSIGIDPATAATGASVWHMHMRMRPNPPSAGRFAYVRLKTHAGAFCVGAVLFPRENGPMQPLGGTTNRHGRLRFRFKVPGRRHATLAEECMGNHHKAVGRLRFTIRRPGSVGNRSRRAGTMPTSLPIAATDYVRLLASAEHSTLATPFTFKQSSRQFLSSPGSLTTFTFERFHGYYAKTLPGVESERGHTTTATYGNGHGGSGLHTVPYAQITRGGDQATLQNATWICLPSGIPPFDPWLIPKPAGLTGLTSKPATLRGIPVWRMSAPGGGLAGSGPVPNAHGKTVWWVEKAAPHRWLRVDTVAVVRDKGSVEDSRTWTRIGPPAARRAVTLPKACASQLPAG